MQTADTASTGQHIVFAHGNSFPGGTYSCLFTELEQRGYTCHPIDKVGHNAQHPVTDNWMHLVDELAAHTRSVVARTGGPVWLVGHSLGGVLSLLVAARYPELSRGVVLVDSPLLAGWKAWVLSALKRSGLVSRLSPGKVSRTRRNQWPDAQSALAHFQSKPVFSRWHPAVLQDYITHGTVEQGDRRVLAFDRLVETAIYNTLPHNVPSTLRHHPLQCPVGFVGGLDSEECRTVGLDLVRRITQGRMVMLPGTHLIPMEAPQATAAAIDSLLLGLAGADD